MNKIKIGTKFKRINNKRQDIETVTDIYKTYNSKNELIKISYVSEYTFLNQTIKSYDIPGSTIIRGLIKI